MAYEVNFGSVRGAASRPVTAKTGKFRLAVLGDFSARANSGRLDTGAALATRKPLKVDCDNLDATLKRLVVKLRLPLAADGAAVEVAVNSMDDFHPDQLYGSLPIFSELAGLRQRLKTTSTFAKAAQEVQSWAGVEAEPPPRERAGGAAIPVDATLSDFARLVGEPTASPAGKLSIADLLKRVVGPYVVPAKDPRADKLVATVDAALAATMRTLLHHPDFQAAEALWRSVDLLVRTLETDEQLQIVLYDVSAEELAADLSQADALENSGLYKLLVEQPALDAAQGPFTVVVGHYQFEQAPPHAELLGRVARIVAASQTAFIASVGPSCLDTKPADLHPLVREAWDALAKLPESAYVGLVTPRFLVRRPYGEGSDPIDSFDFEEFTPQAGLSGMLWGNPAIIAGLLLGQTFAQQGAKMQPGSVLSLGDMPYHFYTDADGDQIALPCTERMMSSRTAEQVRKHRFMPLLAIKGEPQVRLAGFESLADRQLAGSWKPAAVPVPETPAVEEAAPPAESAEESPVAEAPAADPELDELLKTLSEETAPTPAPAETPTAEGGEPEMDPELAKLLKELGG